MKFLVGLVIGAIIAAAIGAGAIAVALGEIDEVDVANRDKSGDVSQTFELRDFDKIDVAGVYELEVMVGEDYSIVISGPSEEMERVQAKVEDGSLVLDQTKQQKRGIGVLHKEGVTAKVSLPALSELDVSGVVDGDVSGVDAEAFTVNLSGVGDVDIEGTCTDLTARVSGVGNLNARELECKTARVNVSGVGDAKVYASESVDANISGMGDIDVYGSPAKVEKNDSMFSRIKVH